ncbi:MULTISPECIES: hypothetical protein [Flavobacterium]|uniref:Annexin n=1 Tax=Flavobacterium chilense TaxID=946677 RepID=A0A1M7L1Q6_9FLAO|nr:MULTISPECIES: hypothetical protein [Flavobacterium]MDL2143573.1 hypothetical protein [Flavobacterium tructae]SHM71739.1 hypothetical protein SAMN05444484_108223 [Flavobacterium chilense]
MMTTQKKVIIVTASVVILGLGAYFLTKTNKNGKSLLGSNKKYIDEGDVNLVPVFSASQKVALLYEAMNRYSGTDETLIFETLTGVSQAQFGLISKTFGLKNYNRVLGYNTIGGSKLPLKTWLKEELNDADYSLLRKKFPSYL